jgi:hypothetical protein
MKILQVVVSDEVHRRAKARAASEGVTLKALVERAVLREAGGSDAGFRSAVERPPEPNEGLKRVARGAKGGAVVAQAEPKSAAPDAAEVVSVVDPACRKCGHRRSQHWDRGCYGACVCAAGRFAAEDV